MSDYSNMADEELERSKKIREIEKLDSEIKNLKRPFLLRPTTWPLLLGLASTTLGWYESCEENKVITKEKELVTMEKDSISNDNSSLKRIKSSLTQESKEDQEIIAIQNSIIKQSSDPQTVQKGKDLKIPAQEPSSTFFTVTKEEDYNVENAKKFEMEGFNYLLSNNVEEAIASFVKSENSYNSYNQVYEIALYLQKNKSKLTDPKSEFWPQVYQKIVEDFSWKMPPDIKERMTTKIGINPSAR